MRSQRVRHDWVTYILSLFTQLMKIYFPGGSEGETSACNAGDPGSIPRLGRSPGEGNGYLLQYSGLENSMDRGAWQETHMFNMLSNIWKLMYLTISTQITHWTCSFVDFYFLQNINYNMKLCLSYKKNHRV